VRADAGIEGKKTSFLLYFIVSRLHACGDIATAVGGGLMRMQSIYSSLTSNAARPSAACGAHAPAAGWQPAFASVRAHEAAAVQLVSAAGSEAPTFFSSLSSM